MAEKLDKDFVIEELRIENAELKQDIEDFCYVTAEFLALMGIKITSIRDGVKTRDVVKSIKSKLFMIATDDEGFIGLIGHFAPEAIRIGEKYESLALEVSQRKQQEKGINEH